MGVPGKQSGRKVLQKNKVDLFFDLAILSHINYLNKLNVCLWKRSSRNHNLWKRKPEKKKKRKVVGVVEVKVKTIRLQNYFYPLLWCILMYAGLSFLSQSPFPSTWLRVNVFSGPCSDADHCGRYRQQGPQNQLVKCGQRDVMDLMEDTECPVFKHGVSNFVVFSEDLSENIFNEVCLGKTRENVDKRIKIRCFFAMGRSAFKVYTVLMWQSVWAKCNEKGNETKWELNEKSQACQLLLMQQEVLAKLSVSAPLQPGFAVSLVSAPGDGGAFGRVRALASQPPRVYKDTRGHSLWILISTPLIHVSFRCSPLILSSLWSLHLNSAPSTVRHEAAHVEVLETSQEVKLPYMLVIKEAICCWSCTAITFWFIEKECFVG